MCDLVQSFLTARRVATPLLAIQTAEPRALINRLQQSLKDPDKLPIFEWDAVRGLVGKTDVARYALAKLVADPKNPMMGGEMIPQGATRELAVSLSLATEMPEETLFFVLNAHRWIDPALAETAAVCTQSIWNLRDNFKSKGATLVLLAPDFRLPRELDQDVFLLDDPLPGDAELREILLEQFRLARQNVAQLADPDAETERRALEALRGLAAFPAEEAIANSLTREGLHLPRLWERKRQVVQQVPGLTMHTSGETFADIGGLANYKRYMQLLFRPGCPAPITAIVFMDETEKALGNVSGPVADNTNVSQDFLGVLLQQMEDNNWTGIFAAGPPGSAKSLAAKATGNTFGVPTLRLDLGALKAGIVGESERNIRHAMKVIRGIAGEGAFFIATANKLDVIPPEFRRRFRQGVWFFDLPDAEERRLIWQIHLAHYGLGPHEDLPEDDDWTGSDIRNACDLAWRMQTSVFEAAMDVIPIARQDRLMVERLRQAAHGSWISAAYPGPYRADRNEGPPAARRLALEE